MSPPPLWGLLEVVVVECEDVAEDLVEHEVEDSQADKHECSLGDVCHSQEHAARDQCDHAAVRVILQRIEWNIDFISRKHSIL